MSEQVPGECRSTDCKERAMWNVQQIREMPRLHKRGPRPRALQWHGEFCTEHLLRCIPIKMEELEMWDKLVVKPIGQWSS